jgi:HSP20 family protein
MNFSVWNANPWSEFFEMDRLFDRLVTPTLKSDEGAFQPSCEVEETKSLFTVNVDLPGVSKQDIHVQVRDNQLVVSGERRRQTTTAGRTERLYGKFYRVFSIPTNVDADKIEGDYQDGVLRLALPKAESAKPRQIKLGEGNSNFFGKFISNKEERKSKETEITSEG